MESCVAVFCANQKVNVRNQLHIPNDLSFSILSKLPIKSLKRFGCVHKSWSLLFDDPNFMTMYRNHFLTKDHSYYDDTSILLHQTFSPFEGDYWDDTFELYSVSGERFKNRVKLDWPHVKLDPIYVDREYDSGFNLLGYGSVHGTLCLFCASQQNIILWNPTIKEFKIIPPNPSGFWRYYLKSFGYDCVKDDYKVMVLDKTQCWIYSLKSDSWRMFDINIDEAIEWLGQLYMDGLSHWLSIEWMDNCTHNEKCLMSFDWSNEVFIKTLIPSNYFSEWCHLVLLNGFIVLIVNYTETTTFHILILGELGVKESWTKIFIVGHLPCLDYPIGAGKKGDMLFTNKDGGLVWLDLNTQMIEDLGIETERFSCKIVIHKENLFPFEGKNI